MKTSTMILVSAVAILTVSFPVMAEEISIVGTGSGMSILQAIGDSFSRDNPGVTIDVPPSIGSGGGIKAVGRDENILGRVARPIKESEQGYGLSYVPIAKMPIVIFANKSVGIDNLTEEQVCKIYDGSITSWKDAGGKEERIRVVRREDGDSSLSVLRESFPGFSNLAITEKSKTTFKDSETLELVQSTAGSIGFGTYADARNYDVAILKISGKYPTESDYMYFGTLALIFKEGNKTGNIQKFVDFADSKAANKAIESAGGIPFK